MRSFFRITALCVFIVVLIGVVIALSIHSAGALDGAVVTIDDRRFEGPLIAVAAGAIAAVALLVAFIVVVSVLACVAIIVPLALALAGIAALFAIGFALVFGLAPLLVPVLLLVGACVLLARWIRRRRSVPPSRGASV